MREPQIKKEFDKNDTLIAKGIAILLMLFYHLFESEQLLESLQVNYAPFSQNMFLTFSGYGNICVAVFAFLSAYGISKGLMERESECTLREMLEMAVKRCGKLIGNFVVMYLSVNLLWFTYFDYRGLYGEGWQGGMLAVIDMLGLAPLFNTPTLNMTWWYMSLAIMIIFGMPFLYLLVEKIGKYALIPAVLLPLAVELDEGVSRYLVVIVLGAVAARENWLQESGRDGRRIWKALGGAVLIMASVLIRQNYIVHSSFLWIIDAPIALLLCRFGGEIPGHIPGVRQILVFFGKHSMNIYFVHTFFYMAIYQKFIYSFRYAGLIFVVLVAVTSVYSVILEFLKKIGRKGLGRLRSVRRV